MMARARTEPDRQRLAGSEARDLLLSETQVTQRRLEIANVSTSVLEAGDGPPIVLLHGGIEVGGVIWTPVISPLAREHRVVVPDLPGLGESDPMSSIDDGTFARWFTALLETTCDEPPVLVAHSLMGTMALRYAEAHRERLRRLIVCAAPGVGPYRMPMGLRMVAIRFAIRPSEQSAERFDRWAFYNFDRARSERPDWFRGFSAYSLSRAVVPHVKTTMQRLIKSCTKQVPDSQLSRIALPTALIWGRHDRFVPLGLAEGASARLGWPLHVIEEAGHVPHVEQSEAFLAALCSEVDK